MKRFANMDRRLSNSMPLLPLSYVSIKNPANLGRGRTQHRRYWVNGVGPTRLVGLSPSHRPPQRLILCTAHGSYEKVTRSSSYVELSHSGVYRSRDDMRDARAERRAASYEDMYRGTVSTCWGDTSRFSESGVSVNCSHTDDGSFMGVEEDAVSQSSFGSSSAFHEMTCDSELDRPDSDCLSVPGSERSRTALRAERELSLPGTQTHVGLHASSKTHRTASSHNGESDASSVRSGEFFHSTPTKKGALSLAIFPADDDLQLTGKDSPSSSQPTSPRSQRKAGDKHKTNKSPMHSPRDSVRESVKRSREQFFSSLQDCCKLDDLSAGDSIQTWVSTGHRPTGVSNWVNDLSSSLQRQLQHQNQNNADSKMSSPSLGTGARVSVSERVKALEIGRGADEGVKALETGRGSSDAGEVCTKNTDAVNNAAPTEPGAAVFSSRQLRQPAPHSASQIGPSLAGGGGYEIGNFGSETRVTGTAVSSKVSQGEDKKNKVGTVGTTANSADTTENSADTTANSADTTANSADSTTENSAEIADQWRRIRSANEQDSAVISRSRRDGLSSLANTGVITAGVKHLAAKRTKLTSEECVAGGGSPAASDHETFHRVALFTTDRQSNKQVACEGEGVGGAPGEGVSGRELHDTVRSSPQSSELCDARPDQQAAHTASDENLTAHLSPHDENNSICETDTPPPLPSTPPPTFPSPTSPLELELHQQNVTTPSALSVNMSRGRNENLAPQDDGAWMTCSTEPGARYVDGSEEHDPDVRIREISRTHTRHIHRTTVQQIVTTHRTLRPGEDTIQRLPNSYANGVYEADSGHTATDRIVSTVVEDSDREETTRYSTTQQHLAYSPSHRAPGGGEGGGGIASLDTHGSPLPGVHADSTTTQHQLTQPHDQLQQQHSFIATTTGADMQSSPKFSLLDSLQEQLSRLSSDDVTLDGSFSSDRYSRQVWGYRDHAEASLPDYDTERSGTVSHGEIDSKSRVRGMGSVFITLDKSGQEFSAYVQHSLDSPPSEENDSQHKWRESFSSDDGEARDRGGGRFTPPTQHVGKVLWRPPWSSSSELDDSDGNYSSISTTESSQYPPTHTDSDYLASEGPEDYDNVNSFTDFVSGLKGQSTSDQPSSRHVHYDMLRSPVIQETILEADDESESADDANTTLNTTLNISLNSFKTSLHFSVQAQSTPTAPTPLNVPQIRLWSSDQLITTLSPSGGDVTSTLSPVHPLQELSERLSSISSVRDTSDRMSTVSDASFEMEHHLSRTLDSHLSHTLDSQHLDELDASLARMSSCSSPVPSDVSEGSVYSCVGFAEVKKNANLTSSADIRSGASKAKSSVSDERRNLATTFKSMKESDWVLEKQVLFERLLSDLERQSRPQTRVMFDELCHLENQQRVGDATDACDDWYRAFTREDLEKRQNHICPIIDHHIMPVFRFKRFLKKNHSSKMKGKSQFRIVNKLDRLAESPPEGVTSLTETDIAIRLRQRPYERGVKLSHRLPSDVFTDDGDVKKSFSDSAYSTMSSVSSRNWSDFDSVTSVSSSRGDVSSVTVDSSLDGDKLSALSDVFEQLDVCEGEIDQALLDRLRAGHHSVAPFHLDTRRHRYSHH